MKFTAWLHDKHLDCQIPEDAPCLPTGLDVCDWLRRWYDGEHVKIEFDTEANTATVLSCEDRKNE